MEEERAKKQEKIRPFKSDFKTCLKIKASLDLGRSKSWQDSLRVDANSQIEAMLGRLPSELKIYVNVFQNDR